MEAGERFTWLAELFDGVTRGHFDRLGLSAGWRCWEVAAGGRQHSRGTRRDRRSNRFLPATDINPGGWPATG
ncbi:hypothetical protein KZZ52_42630 [Dactylosporangium sp. AC04546]|uniref:hypothetical protein n=1 Tax=Dactylosporangium sp. AC04546 TaxID=2862460 RepID=UPI001EDD8627|nr:hypothetical protein [Dactylosporangium sp. AC04546]WVK80611.1 hypothetical protein KZZ52_42630 [Dactylosporangium sp. AC04546]